MDASLEQPTLVTPKVSDVPLEDDDQSSGDEDGALDWTKIM
jgi:tRNA-splicing endonuclease subunit Sen54